MISRAANCLLPDLREHVERLLAYSVRFTVNEKSVWPTRRCSARSCRRRRWPRRSDRGSRYAMPGLSGTPITEILASSRLNAMPEMIACSIVSSSSNVMSVPGADDSGSSNDDRTRSLTLYLPANSTERICRTLEPRLAISSISSNVTVVEPPRLGHDARVGRVDAVDVGVDLALVGLERGGKRDARRIGTAAAERGDVAVGIHALEAGDDDDRCRRRDRGACWPRRSPECAPWCTRCRSGCAPARRCSSSPCSPSSCNAIASRPIVTCSPVAATTSSSRRIGIGRELLGESEKAVRLA